MDHQTFWDNWLPAWANTRQIPPAKKVEGGWLFDEINHGKREQELLLYSPDELALYRDELGDKDYLCISRLAGGFIPPKGWVHRQFSSMMTHDNLSQQAINLGENITICTKKSENRTAIRLMLNGEIICSGQVGYHGNFVVFDRIETAENHRRQGFATQMMNLLTNDAVERGISQGLLCASNQGKPLYGKLGWKEIGQYSRMVRE